MNYYRDFVLPGKKFRQPSEEERVLLNRMREMLTAADQGNEDELQGIPFDLARETGVEPKDLFRTFYEVLLGQERGPRFGSFVKLVGRERVLEMLAEKTAP